jgi:alpha-amylase/alpha-mannosidase (GH57 family)
VIWGLADFAHRFGRPAEGMWLPEAAVNTDSLEALAAQGVKYTVLSPRSAPAQSTDGAPIVSTQPYRCALPSGKSIAIFFYNGPISQAVAFEQLLSDGARLAERLTSAAKQAPEDNALVHIATDGETYGHHHRFGDMALAFALTAIEGRDDVRLTNYGEYLERFPPTREVRIVENTSWSCEHGIERWRSHCGCSGGRHQGADQKWRTPLRAALDHLRNEMARGFQDKCGALLQDPWRARNRFILVLLGDLPKKAFLETEAKRPLSPAEEALVFSELDAQRYAMFMYTSCGWFFDDLGDIETVQILAYAARALELSAAPSELRTRFLRLLYEARSALPGHQTAQDTLRRVVSEQSVEHLLDAWESAPGDEQLMFRILEALELAPPALITERRAQALYQRSRNRGEALTALGRKLGFD